MFAAGEVEQFAYCPHNWWLARREGDPEPHAGRDGVREHDRVGRAQQQAEREKRGATDATRWSFNVLLAAVSLTFLTLELLFLRASPHHLIFLATALVMVGGSAGLLTIASLQELAYRRRLKEGNLVPGRLVESDLAHQAPLMEDPEWGVRGRPDYVLATDHGVVPVEVKSGRTPPAPHESHVLQLACYLRLLEVRHVKPPEYGLVTYPEGVFRVAWDPDIQDRLRGVLRRMEAASEAGRADRDHQHVARCRGCARRSVCDQRLA